MVILLSLFLNNLFKNIFSSTKTNLILKFVTVITLFIFLPIIFRQPNLSSYRIDNNQQITNHKKSAFSKRRPNIIWIVLDTVRKDHLSCYGYSRETTPNIDKFSKDGVIFTNYISTAPWTLPSHASMFTGLYSSQHGAVHSDKKNELCLPLSKEQVTIAEILKDQNYNTAGFSSNGVVSKWNNFDQGFNFYFHENGTFNNFLEGLIIRTSNSLKGKIRSHRSLRINRFYVSSEINNVLFHWLDKNNSYPMFLFLNYMDAHYGTFYLPGKFSDLYNFSWNKMEKMKKEEIVRGMEEVNKSLQQIHYDWLDCRMRFLDFNLGNLFQKLKLLNIYDNSIIILVSDHGELYGEHKSFDHHLDLYNELINVPLIIKYPKEMDMKGIVDKYIQTVDIMPEVLSKLKIDYPQAVQGQPFDQVNHPIVSELFKSRQISELYPERYYRDLKAIFSKDGTVFKYIKSTNDKNELFNITEDPLELINIVAEKNEIKNKMENEITDWSHFLKPVQFKNERNPKMNKELTDQLKALGYIK